MDKLFKVFSCKNLISPDSFGRFCFFAGGNGPEAHAEAEKLKVPPSGAKESTDPAKVSDKAAAEGVALTTPKWTRSLDKRDAEKKVSITTEKLAKIGVTEAGFKAITGVDFNNGEYELTGVDAVKRNDMVYGIKKVQQELMTRGAKLKYGDDGIFGKETYDALVKFGLQTEKGEVKGKDMIALLGSKPADDMFALLGLKPAAEPAVKVSPEQRIAKQLRRLTTDLNEAGLKKGMVVRITGESKSGDDELMVQSMDGSTFPVKTANLEDYSYGNTEAAVATFQRLDAKAKPDAAPTMLAENKGKAPEKGSFDNTRFVMATVDGLPLPLKKGEYAYVVDNGSPTSPMRLMKEDGTMLSVKPELLAKGDIYKVAPKATDPLPQVLADRAPLFKSGLENHEARVQIATVAAHSDIMPLASAEAAFRDSSDVAPLGGGKEQPAPATAVAAKGAETFPVGDAAEDARREALARRMAATPPIMEAKAAAQEMLRGKDI